MTGTGTQADPFIVDNWPDFVTAVETSGAYVAFPEGGGTIDMNSVAPEGIEQVQLRCVSIEGNGWNIRNLYVSGHGAFYLRSNVIINSLSITDFYGDFQSEEARFFDNGDNNYQYTFNLCTFSGLITGQNTKSGLFKTEYIYAVTKLFRCSMNVRCDGSTKLIYNGGDLISLNSADFCNIKLSGNSLSAIGDSFNYRNCYFSGKCSQSPLNIYGNCNYNVYNVDFSEADDFSCYCSNQGSVNLINSDLLPSGSSINSGFVAVTDAQLHDAEYLTTIGFPIVVMQNG